MNTTKIDKGVRLVARIASHPKVTLEWETPARASVQLEERRWLLWPNSKKFSLLDEKGNVT